MPIQVTTQVRVFDQAEFHAQAEKRLRIVFDVHNEFGRFLDEALYKSEIAARWVAAGLGGVEREVRINLSHEDFQKSYFMDALFNRGLLLEAKAAETLVANHRAQGLHYLFLGGMKHGLLVNLRPERVEHEFLSTSLTPEERRRFTLVDVGWRAVNEESVFLREKLTALLRDWGVFLEISLYREAMTHFLGGPQKVVRTVPVRSADRLIGHQPVHLLTSDTGFAFTALPQNRTAMADHQQRFLRHTPLRFLQWINFNRHRVEFTTLAR
jgi:GxxExxY protein